MIKTKIVLVFLMLFILPTYVYSMDITKDIYFESTWLLVNGIDWIQTREIAKYPKKYSEINPILGKHPSVGIVDKYFVASMLLHGTISYLLPKKYRTIWQVVTIETSGTCVLHNLDAKIKIRF